MQRGCCRGTWDAPTSAACRHLQAVCTKYRKGRHPPVLLLEAVSSAKGSPPVRGPALAGGGVSVGMLACGRGGSCQPGDLNISSSVLAEGGFRKGFEVSPAWLSGEGPSLRKGLLRSGGAAQSAARQRPGSGRVAATCRLQPSSVVRAGCCCMPRRFRSQELIGVRSAEVLQGPQTRCMATVALCRQKQPRHRLSGAGLREVLAGLPALLLGAAAGTEAWLLEFPMRGLSAIRSLNRSASCWALLFWLTWPSFMAPPWRPPAAQTNPSCSGDCLLQLQPALQDQPKLPCWFSTAKAPCDQHTLSLCWLVRPGLCSLWHSEQSSNHPGLTFAAASIMLPG